MSNKQRRTDEVEQPPELTAEENAILDRIWDEFGAREAAQRKADQADDKRKSRKSGWLYESGLDTGQSDGD